MVCCTFLRCPASNEVMTHDCGCRLFKTREFAEGFTTSVSQEKCGIQHEHPSRLSPASPDAAVRPQRAQTEVRAGHADPSLSSAMSRHRATLSLVVMGRREGMRGEEDSNLEKMASAVFFLCGGLWDSAAESVTV